MKMRMRCQKLSGLSRSGSQAVPTWWTAGRTRSSWGDTSDHGLSSDISGISTLQSLLPRLRLQPRYVQEEVRPLLHRQEPPARLVWRLGRLQWGRPEGPGGRGHTSLARLWQGGKVRHHYQTEIRWPRRNDDWWPLQSIHDALQHRHGAELPGLTTSWPLIFQLKSKVNF